MRGEELPGLCAVGPGAAVSVHPTSAEPNIRGWSFPKKSPGKARLRTMCNWEVMVISVRQSLCLVYVEMSWL